MIFKDKILILTELEDGTLPSGWSVNKTSFKFSKGSIPKNLGKRQRWKRYFCFLTNDHFLYKLSLKFNKENEGA